MMTTLVLSLLLLYPYSEALVAPTRLSSTPFDPQEPLSTHSFGEPRNGFTVSDNPDQWIAQELSKEVLDLSEQLRDEKDTENTSPYIFAGKNDYTPSDWQEDKNDSLPKVDSTILSPPTTTARSIDDRLKALNAQLKATRLEMDEVTKENQSLQRLQEQHHRDMDDITKRLEEQIQERAQEQARSAKELETIKRESKHSLKKVHRDANDRIHRERSQFQHRMEQAEDLLQQLKASLNESERQLAQKSDEIVLLEAKKADVKEFTKAISKKANQSAQRKFQRLKRLVQKPFAGRNKAINGDSNPSVTLRMPTTPVVEQDL